LPPRALPARPSRVVPLRRPRLRLAPVLVPTALVLIQTADAAAAGGGLGGLGTGFGATFGSFSSWLNHGPGAGALVIGREDLLRVRSSLGRISDELHTILGVLDQHIEGPASSATAAAIDGKRIAEARGYEPLPQEVNISEEIAASTPRPLISAGISYAWSFGEWLFKFSIFALDICIVVGMQVFLESIGRKRKGSTIMPKKNVASAMAKAAGATVNAAPIPTPSGARETSQRLSVLSQEELLAACLTEHWGKLAVGVGLAVVGRLPVHILKTESILCYMFQNLAVMLRWMSLVMLLIREDMVLPRRDKEDLPPSPPAMPPIPSSPRRRPAALGPPPAVSSAIDRG